MGKRNKLLNRLTAGILILCVSFTGCGIAEGQRSESVPGTDNMEMSSGQAQNPEQTQKPDEAQSTAGEDAEQADPNSVGKEIIVLGRVGTSDKMDEIAKAINAFNQSQEKYFVQMKAYEDYAQFNLDLVRKQGADLFDLGHNVVLETLARKGILEDLTPYFESSRTVGQDDIVEAVWRAGTVEGKMVCVIPCFLCQGIIVEEGYTEDGAWTAGEYLALGEKYPESMLNSSIQSPGSQILTYLKWCVGSFVNWEEKTCDFGGEEFKEILTMLKTYKNRKYDAVSGTTAEAVRGRGYLTQTVQIGLDDQMNSYKDIKEAFLDAYEIAGMPTADGSLRYGMLYTQIYGMNAASENKEGAWAFLEYLLSEEFQKPSSVDYSEKSQISGYFPARRDCLESGLQENVEYVPDPEGRVHYSTNRYTREASAEYREFTEEDKEIVYAMIESTYRDTFGTSYTLLNIITAESEPFFEGTKTLEEVAKIIQNRAALYLME